jgi:hypothetical protein
VALWLSGKSNAEAASAEKKSAAVKRAKDVADTVNRLPDDAVNDRLRDRWKR